MTVSELIEILEDHSPDAPVLIATQQSWPLQNEIEAVTAIGGLEEANGSEVIYLAAQEGGPDRLGPHAPRQAWDGGNVAADGDESDYDVRVG